jgi:hypothetical protein
MSLRVIFATCLACLALAVAATAHADSYELINQAGVKLKVQSKAVDPKPPHSVVPAFYDLEAGVNKQVDFENTRRIMMIHIYDASNMGQNFFYNASADALNGPNKRYRLVVKSGIQVDMQEY